MKNMKHLQLISVQLIMEKHKFLDFNNHKDMVLLKDYIKKSDVVITNFKHGDSKRFNFHIMIVKQ